MKVHGKLILVGKVRTLLNYTQILILSAQKKENQTLEFSDHLPETTFKHYQTNINSWKEDILAPTSPKLEDNRLILTSESLNHELT